MTTDQELLAQVRDELRTLNARLGQQDAQPSRPAVADGLRVTEPDGDPNEPLADRYCEACQREFASPAGLAAHARAKHGG